MSKPTRKICFVSVIGVLLCALAVFPASANSAPSYWQGVSASGVLTTEGECPLVVEHETLIFDIEEFPSNHYGSAEDYLAYDASVTAEYTFYNPSDMTVTAKLLFPFGINPQYGEIYDSDKRDYFTPDNASEYGAQINGAAVQTTVRHSYWNGVIYKFDPAEEMAKLQDDYRTDSFLSYDLPVHVYTYRISVDKQTYRSARAATYFDGAFEHTRFMLENLGGYHSDENGNAGWASVHTSDAEITVYVFGEDVGELEWKFFENGYLETEIEGSMSVVDKTSTTFGALAMQYYDPASGVAAHDWFNAAVAQLEGSDKALGLYGGVVNDWDFSQHLLQWYEYEITLAPGERLTNTVTAPLYPHINGRYEQPTYAYEYFLTPASTWTEFGTLDIYINTPYVMVKERKGEYSIAPMEWTKTDAGYEIHLDGLPDEDLIFTLSTAENPKMVMTAWTWLVIVVILIVAIMGLAGVIVVIILALCALFPLVPIVVATILIVICLIALIISVVRKNKAKKQTPPSDRTTE